MAYTKTPKLQAKFKAATNQTQKDNLAQKIIAKGGRPPKGYGNGLTGNGQGGGLTGAPNYNKMNLSTAGGMLSGQQTADAYTQQQNFLGNRINEQDVYGNTQQYEQDPTTGRWSLKRGLGASEQAKQDAINARDTGLYGLQSQMFGNISNQLSQPLSFNGLPSLAQDYSQDRQRVESSIYDKFQRRMSDQFGQEKEQAKQALADRGIPMGSERYNQEMKQLEQRQNDARLDAQSQAVQMGGQEQQNLFNMGLSGRQQGINETMMQRQTPLNEYGALQGYQSGVNAGNFSPMYQSTMQSPNVIQAGQIQQQGQLTREQMANSKDIARIGASTAGTAAGIGASSAMQQLQLQRQWDLEDQQKLLAMQPKPANPWVTGIGAGIASGIGAGLGAWAGGS
jgi:hypothetical protein